MIKDPKSGYEGKRSWVLLKVKKFDDSEAKVIGHESGKGRNADVLGALKVKEVCPEEYEFKIGGGFDDNLRLNPPAIGSIVTFKY